MTGSIQEKHGKLYAVLCYKDVLGKSQRKWVPTNLEVRGNKKRAESMLPNIIEEYLYLEPKECKSVLFVDYIREWLIRKKADVQLSAAGADGGGGFIVRNDHFSDALRADGNGHGNISFVFRWE